MSAAARAPYVRAQKHLRSPHLMRVSRAHRVSQTEVRRRWAWADVYETLVLLDADATSAANQRAEQEASRG